jgi:hypothetical protein
LPQNAQLVRLLLAAVAAGGEFGLAARRAVRRIGTERTAVLVMT